MKSLTVADRLLLAARQMEREREGDFTAEDLVVAAWRKFPRVFGLAGYLDERGDPLYPDSNRVFAEVMGSKPLRVRGLLVKSGNKRYALTTTGRQAADAIAAMLQGGISGEPRGRLTLARDEVSRLERLLNSKALVKLEGGDRDLITFHDACLFWGISSGSSAIQLEGKLASLLSDIAHLESFVGQSDAPIFIAGRDGAMSVKLLSKVHGELLERFADEIATIRQRVDERRGR